MNFNAIKTSGDVGIGTTNPHGKLNIIGGNDVTLGSDSGFLVLGVLLLGLAKIAEIRDRAAARRSPAAGEEPR